MNDLQGKIALVTGASRGIGRAIAIRLARAGADVAVNYLQNAEAAERTAALVREAGARAVTVPADVRDLEQVKTMHATAASALGPVDILVNNAGIVRDNLVTFMSDEEWNDVLDTDLKSAFYCVKVVGKEMVRRRHGKIVNIASVAGLLGDMMRANYAAAKAGLIGLTKTVAREFAASGVQVNAIAPGLIETDLIAGLTETKRNKQLAMIPMARFGAPDEVAEAALFLASSASDYITGEVLVVDGGLHTR